MSYAELDCIADLYNPFLLLCCFVLLAKRFYSNRSVKSLALQVMALGLYLLGVYALMALDQRFYIWPALGWDYSTHSAFAVACCWFLWSGSKSRIKARISWSLSLLGYLLLMHYQRYHTAIDMISTMLVIALWIAIVDRCLRRFKSGNLSSSQNPGYGHNRY